MKKYILSFIFLGALISCSKDSVEDPDVTPPSQAAAAVLDPVNYAPAVTKVLPTAIQLNFGSVRVGKSMNLTLTHITPDVMANYSIHIYLKSGIKYHHLPGISLAGISYNYSLKAVFPYCSTTITRAQGTVEAFDDVIVVAAKNSVLLTMTPSLNFSDYNVVKVKLGL